MLVSLQTVYLSHQWIIPVLPQVTGSYLSHQVHRHVACVGVWTLSCRRLGSRHRTLSLLSRSANGPTPPAESSCITPGLRPSATATNTELQNYYKESAVCFLMMLGKKIAQQTGNECKTAFLFQRLSVLVQRFNCVLLHDSFVDDDCPD